MANFLFLANNLYKADLQAETKPTIAGEVTAMKPVDPNESE